MNRSARAGLFSAAVLIAAALSGCALEAQDDAALEPDALDRAALAQPEFEIGEPKGGGAPNGEDPVADPQPEPQNPSDDDAVSDAEGEEADPRPFVAKEWRKEDPDVVPEAARIPSTSRPGSGGARSHD